MRKRQQPLYVLDSSQLKAETTCSSRSSSPFLRYVGLPVCQKGAFLKGASLRWSVTVGKPSLLPQAGFQLPHLLFSWSNPGIFKYFLKEAVAVPCPMTFSTSCCGFCKPVVDWLNSVTNPTTLPLGSCMQLSGLERVCPSHFPRWFQGCH